MSKESAISILIGAVISIVVVALIFVAYASITDNSSESPIVKESDYDNVLSPYELRILANTPPYIIYGTVTDENFDPAQNQTVTLKNLRTGDKITTLTNEKGQYQETINNFDNSYEDGDSVSIQVCDQFKVITVTEGDMGSEVHFIQVTITGPEPATEQGKAGDLTVDDPLFSQLSLMICLPIPIIIVVILTALMFSRTKKQRIKARLDRGEHITGYPHKDIGYLQARKDIGEINSLPDLFKYGKFLPDRDLYWIEVERIGTSREPVWQWKVILDSSELDPSTITDEKQTMIDIKDACIELSKDEPFAASIPENADLKWRVEFGEDTITTYFVATDPREQNLEDEYNRVCKLERTRAVPEPDTDGIGIIHKR